MRLGLIRNPLSRANRRDRADWDAVTAHPQIAGFVEPKTSEELHDSLKILHAREVQCLAVSGGDGTLSDVLSALAHAVPGWRPPFAILRSGKTNLIAHDVGAAPHGVRGALALADAARTGDLTRRKTRRVLKVESDEGGSATRYGFFLGAGAFTRASNLAQVQAHAMGLNEGAAILWTLGSMIGRNLPGGHETKEPCAIAASQPAGAPESGARYLVIATTLDRIALGLKPFWGNGSGPIRYTEVPAAANRLAHALVPVLRGRPKPWMSDAGYRSGSTTALRLQLEGVVTLDGEPFQPSPNGAVRITADDTVTFLAP